MSEPSAPAVRWVRCPACGRKALYSAENAARPFCSARCRGVDLGAWASESYRVADSSPAQGEAPDAPPH
jgi:uncharacterized protein